jgi:hypothetical protein
VRHFISPGHCRFSPRLATREVGKPQAGPTHAFGMIGRKQSHPEFLFNVAAVAAKRTATIVEPMPTADGVVRGDCDTEGPED